MLSLAYASAAHAGHWEIKYQADGAVQYTASSQYHPEDAGSTIGGNPFNKSLKGYSGGASWVDSDLLPGGIGRDSFGSSVSVGTSFNFGFDKYHGAVDDGGSVTAILQWTPENASDQQTPPTRIHLRETSRVSASGSFSTYYGASYTQEPFSLDVTNGAGGAVQESQSDGTTTKTAKSDRLLEIANPSASSVVHVPTRTFRAQASGGFFRWEDLINNITSFGVSAEISYTVQIVGFEMTVSRRGSGKDLSHSATVAAGGKSTDEHQADILIQAYPPLAGLLVAPRISVGESGETANGAITLDSGVTDANGQIKGTYKSSDVIQPVTLRLDVGEGPSAEDRINQVWADKTDAALWQYDPILDTENPNPITFKPRFKDGVFVPITTHTMSFVVKRVDYQVWDADLGDYNDVSTTNPTEVVKVATFDPASGVADSGGGVYSSNLTIHTQDPANPDAPQKQVSKVFFDVEDANAYE